MFNVQFDIVTRCSQIGGLSTTQQISYQLFTDSKMSTVSHHYQLTYVAIVRNTCFFHHVLQEDVAKERGLSPQTVLNHLAMAMEAGHFVDYRRGMHS